MRPPYLPGVFEHGFADMVVHVLLRGVLRVELGGRAAGCVVAVFLGDHAVVRPVRVVERKVPLVFILRVDDGRLRALATVGGGWMHRPRHGLAPAAPSQYSRTAAAHLHANDAPRLGFHLAGVERPHADRDLDALGRHRDLQALSRTCRPSRGGRDRADECSTPNRYFFVASQNITRVRGLTRLNRAISG